LNSGGLRRRRCTSAEPDLPRFPTESLERLIERPVEFGLFGYEPFQFGFGLPALAAAEAAVRQFNPELLDLIIGCKHCVSPSV
jgi:hypothetical protein